MRKSELSASALLLIDIQMDYFVGGKMPLDNAVQAMENAGRLLKHYRAGNRPVIHIKHLSTREDSSFFIPSTSGAELHPGVAPAENEKVIVKHFPNAFQGTNLLDFLNSLGVEKLVIGGMMSHMCVDSTTRAAKDYGFECVVIEDTCATKSLVFRNHLVKSQEVHNAFMSALGYYFAKVLTTTAYLSCNPPS